MSLLRKHSTRKSSILKKSQSKSQDVEYSALDLSSLRRQRTIAYKRMCKALEVGVLAINDEAQRDMFFSYHQDIKKIASNFEDAHFTILDILDDPETDDSGIQERFDEMYYKVISIYRNLNKGETCTSRSPSSSLSNVRLPKIQLPTFAGDIKHFPEYFDTFNALIHNSTSLNDTEKFHYLISSLSGDALTVVKTFPLSSEYYRDAYAALTARYKCKRELAFTCWREILTMKFNVKDAHDFRKSLDLLEENLCILKSVNLPVTHWDFVLVYHILSKLDTNLRRDFEEKHSNTELPSYAQLKQFLHSKCEALLRDKHFTEETQQNKTTQKLAPPPVQPKRVPTSYTLLAADQSQTEGRGSATAIRPITCSFCNESHSISSCPAFLEKSIDERMKIATDRNWCFNCLKSSHQLRTCNSVFTCRTCKRKHHSLLHRPASTEANLTESALVSSSRTNTTVLLATAIVHVQDASGGMHSFRALFDTGSQSSLITESAVERLGLNRSQSVTNVSGVGEVAASISGNVTCCMGLRDKPAFTLDLHVISKICGNQPISKLNTSGWSHIESLKMADPNFDTPGPIDLLLAADVFAESLLDQPIRGGSNQPIALNSIFGWLLLGKTSLSSLPTSDIDNVVDNCWQLRCTSKSLFPTSTVSVSEQTEISRKRNKAQCVMLISSCPSTDPHLIRSKLQPNIGAIKPPSIHVASPGHHDNQKLVRSLTRENLSATPIVTYGHVSSPYFPYLYVKRFEKDDKTTHIIAERQIAYRDFIDKEPINTSENNHEEILQKCQSSWWAGPHCLFQDRKPQSSRLILTFLREEIILNAEARNLTYSVTEGELGNKTSGAFMFDNSLHRHYLSENLIHGLSCINRLVNNTQYPLDANRNIVLCNGNPQNALPTTFCVFLKDGDRLKMGGRKFRPDIENERKHPALVASEPLVISYFMHRYNHYNHSLSKRRYSQPLMSELAFYVRQRLHAFKPDSSSSGPFRNKLHCSIVNSQTSVHDEDLAHVNRHRLHRWQLSWMLHQNFESRWKLEHVLWLTHRSKWAYNSPFHLLLNHSTYLLPHGPGAARIGVLRNATCNTFPRGWIGLCPLPLET